MSPEDLETLQTMAADVEAKKAAYLLACHRLKRTITRLENADPSVEAFFSTVASVKEMRVWVDTEEDRAERLEMEKRRVEGEAAVQRRLQEARAKIGGKGEGGEFK